MKNKIQPLLAFTILCITIIGMIAPIQKNKVVFEIDYDKNIKSTAQLFYDIGSGYTEDDSVYADIKNKRVKLYIDRSLLGKITMLRLDPVAEKQDDFKIEAIHISYNKKEILKLSSGELRKYTESVANAAIDDKSVLLTDVQNDPCMYFNSELVSIVKKDIAGKIKLMIFLKRLFRTVIILGFTGLVSLFFYKNKRLRKAVCNLFEKNQLGSVGMVQLILIIISDILLIAIAILYTVKDFLIENFNGLSFSEIVFHLKVPMEGTSTDMFSEYFKTKSVILIGTVIFLAAVDICVFKIRKLLFNRLTYILGFICSLFVFIGAGTVCLKQLGMIDYLKSQMDRNLLILPC